MSITDARGKQVSCTYDAAGRRTAEYDTTGGAAETGANQLDAWTYDTLDSGRPTSSTAFQNGAAYTEAVTGYNALGMPSGDQVTIPAAQGRPGFFQAEDGIRDLTVTGVQTCALPI